MAWTKGRSQKITFTLQWFYDVNNDVVEVKIVTADIRMEIIGILKIMEMIIVTMGIMIYDI